MQATKKRIEVVVRPDGQSSVETKGFAGAECAEASRFLEAALGTPRSGGRTGEYYSTVTTADAGVTSARPASDD